jgi:hypothetical protein
MATEFFRFRARNPATGKWYRPRYVAPLETIRDRHAEGDYEVLGIAEVRERDGDHRGLTAGHVQSSPVASAPLPQDLAAPPDSRTGTASAEGREALEACREPAAWGARRLPETSSGLPGDSLSPF